MEKKIDFILKGREKNVGPETVLQPLPHKEFRFASPFIVLHHLAPIQFQPGSPPERLHPHPHRGFAPVTFMFQGEGYHRDSAGHTGTIKEGEVQWMFAGRGLLHSEGPTKELLEKGGSYEFVQLWVNVPAKHKMDEPYYQQAAREEMPRVFSEEGNELRLASGSYDQLEGPIQSFTPVTSIFGTVRSGITFQFHAIEGYWTLLYLLEGEVLLNETHSISGRHLVVFSKEGTDIRVEVKANSKILYLSAEPIMEPVAAKGNIVMNTEEEIKQAEKDISEGLFGSLDY
jgi:redox-sensitive bicupin YhaK (pirin superfamily)